MFKYTPNDTFPIEKQSKEKLKKNLEYFVHYIRWPNSYDEWKLANDVYKVTKGGKNINILWKKIVYRKDDMVQVLKHVKSLKGDYKGICCTH